MPPETKTTAEKPLVDTRPVTEQRLAAHVDNWTPPAVPDEELAEAEVEVGDLKLPKDLKKVLALQEEIQAEEVKTTKDAKQKQKKLEIISAHLHSISQGPAAPVLTAKTHSALAGVQSDNAKAFRLEMLGREHAEVKELAQAHAVALRQIEELTARSKPRTKQFLN